MEEIGLEPSSKNQIVDQDTRNVLKFNGKFLVPPGSAIDKATTVFDPVRNVKLMNQMFGYYAKKLEDEEDNRINVFYSVETDKTAGKGYLEIKGDDNSVIRSKEYMNDCLKYADAILQLSGEDDVDLTEYDSPKEDPKAKPTVKKRTTAKKK